MKPFVPSTPVILTPEEIRRLHAEGRAATKPPPPRPVRALIDALKAGAPLSAGEKLCVGTLLDAYWRAPCRRCRREWRIDHLDARDGRCEECVEVIAREGR